MRLSSSLTARLVHLCFFLSGATGLIYQVLWVRMADKVIGSAPFAVATVLTVFMGGLALGSYLAGRYVDRVPAGKELLALYGRLEIAIAAAALALPLVAPLLQPLYRFAYARLFEHFWAYQIFCFAGCLALLIVPTGLMGATLPLLCRYFVERLDRLGQRTGRLYGLNTVGAAAGALLAGFVLIEHLGVDTTLSLAAGVNLSIGAACLVLARAQRLHRPATARSVRCTPPAGATASPAPETGEAVCNRLDRPCWAVVLFAVSGFCAMAYEVFWTRLLALIIGPTTYSFTIVVATFILGLAAGSLVFGRVADHSRSPFAWLVVTQASGAILALAASQIMGGSQFFFAKLIAAFQDRSEIMLRVQALVLMGILLGPTVLLGATFPLVNRIYARRLAAVGRSIGTAYALNTAGAILGSLSAGFILIPLVGKQDGLWLVCLLQLGTAGAAALATGGLRGRSAWRPAAAVVGLLMAFCLAARYPHWDPALFSRGWYRDLDAIRADLGRTGWWEAVVRGPERLAGRRSGIELVFCGEGIGGFTTVEKEVTSLGTVEYALFNSGKPDASSHGDRSTQTLSAHIPMLFTPAAETVMVLGLASGMTCGEVLHYPVRRLDILEINEQVALACRRFFSAWNNRCLDDPRTRLIVQDGRNHLALTAMRYDVIISEPSNPWMAGLANLYSREFFDLVRRRLTSRGIFAQWIQAYEMDWETFALLGRTFAAVFPAGALIKIGPVDYLLIGRADDQPLDWNTARRNLPHAKKSRQAAFSGIELIAHLVVTEDLAALFDPGPLHTDDRPRLEFAAPRLLYRGHLDVDGRAAPRRRLTDTTRQILAAHDGPAALLDLVAFGASANVPLFKVLDARWLSAPEQARYLDVVAAYCRRTLVPSYDIFNDAPARRTCARIHAERIAAHVAQHPPRAHDHYNLGLALTAAGRLAEAALAFEETIARAPEHAAAHTALGLLLAEAGNPDATVHLSRALALDPADTAACNALGRLLLIQGRVDAAAVQFARAVALSPHNAEAHHNLGTVLFRQGRLAQARGQFAEALRLAPENENTRYNLEQVSRRLTGPAGGNTSSENWRSAN